MLVPMRRGAVLLLGVLLASCASASRAPGHRGQAPAGHPQAATPAPATASEPHVVWKPIPFGPKRKREMAAYSKRHYGTATWRLTNPHVVVEHYTGSDCFSCAWNTFASNSPDLGELPGTCAHFIVDRDGTIYQLVHLGIRCRHTVGLNWTALRRSCATRGSWARRCTSRCG